MKILVVASENDRVGGGHVSRQISLAQTAISRNIGVIFFGEHSVRSQERLDSLGVCRVPLNAGQNVDSYRKSLLPFSSTREPVWLLIDSYDLGHELSSGLKDAFPQQILFQDGGPLVDTPTILVDSGHRESSYSRASALASGVTELITGAQAAIIRPELHSIRATRLAQINERPSRSLGIVNFGSADYADASFQSAKLLCELDFLCEFEIFLGPLYSGLLSQGSFMNSLISVVSSQTRFHSALGRGNFALGAAGVSSFERAYLGLPSLLVSTAGNQDGIAQTLSELNAAFNLGRVEDLTLDSLATGLDFILDFENRRNLALAGMEALDGMGAERVIEAAQRVNLSL